MKNPLLTAALAVLIISSSLGTNSAVAGFSISNLVKQAEVIKVTAVNSATSSAIKVSTMVRGFAANDPYQIKTIEVPKVNYMTRLKVGMGDSGGLKGLVKRNAWYAGWLATMVAAGWAIDELQNQVTVTSNTVTIGNVQCYAINGYYLGIVQGPAGCQAKIIQAYGGEISFRDPIPNPTPEQYSCLLNTPPMPTCSSVVIRFKFYNSTGSPFDGSYIIPSPSSVQVGTQTKPVTDDALYDSIVAQMLKDPQKAADAFMVPDAYPYPYPNIFPSQVPYIPGVSEADQDALDLYYKGLLQSTNPSGANYVTPERYQQIADLATKLQQGQTPQGQADAMNDQLKKPLTQKELEESMKKDREAEDKATKEALGPQPALDKLIDPFNNFSEGVKNTPNEVINDLPSNNFSFSGAGKCYTFDKTYTIMGASWTLSTRQFCDSYYYPYFLPIMTWFFYIATGLYIWFSLRDAYARRF